MEGGNLQFENDREKVDFFKRYFENLVMANNSAEKGTSGQAVGPSDAPVVRHQDYEYYYRQLPQEQLHQTRVVNDWEANKYPSSVGPHQLELFRRDYRIGSLPILTLSNVLDNLSALKTLENSYCNNLEFLEDFKYLSSLEKLVISRCDGLTSFPVSLLEGMFSLRSLSFQNCNKLKPLLGPLEQSPPALHDLQLNGLPELEYLPENVQLLTSVTELRIWHCEKICSLPNWLGHLEALSLLKIWYCEKLKSLPDGFKGLKSLRRLEIKGCAQLEKRYKKPKGEDWPKISHIPIIKIIDDVIQHLD